MKFIWENNWFFIPVAFFLGLCGMLAMIVPYGHEILYFNDLRFEPFNAMFQFFTQCGEAWAYLIFGLGVIYWRPRYALVIAVVGVLSLPVGYLVKDAIGVDRPITYFEKNAAADQLILVPDTRLNRGQTSFPSGHTMSAFALYSLLSLMVGRERKQWGLLFALLAILVGISRIFLVQHFLVDVMAGAILGLLLGGLVWWSAHRFLPNAEILHRPRKKRNSPITDQP